MHRLDDAVLITPALLRRLDAEGEVDGGNGCYWALLARSNGDLIEHAKGPEPIAEQRVFAIDMVPALNRNLHHDGAWLVAFVHPKPPPLAIMYTAEFARFVFLWMDGDGDIRFPVECDDDFGVVLTKGPDYWIEQCEQAWITWDVMMRQVLAPKPEQLFKRAQGQVAPTAANQNVQTPANQN